MQLDPAPTLPTATSPSAGDCAAALPPGSTASLPGGGAAGAAGAATASPSEGGVAAAAAATAALLPGALLGLGLGVASEGSEASSLGSRASSSSNLRCAGSTLVRSKHSYSCMADAAAAAPLRMLLVEDNAINMKVSSVLHRVRCGRQLFNGSVAGGGQGHEEDAGSLEAGCCRACCCTCTRREAAACQGLASWRLHLRRLCLNCTLLASAAGCTGHPAPHGLHQHRYRRGRGGSAGGPACACCVAHRDCCSQGLLLARVGSCCVLMLCCWLHQAGLCSNCAGLLPGGRTPGLRASPGWLQPLSLRCYLQFYPLSRPTPPPRTTSTWHCRRRLADQTRLMSSSWTCTCRAR